MGQAKNGPDLGAFARLRTDGKVPAGHQCGHFEKRDAQPHLAGGTGGVERVLHMGDLFGGHAATVVSDGNDQPVFGRQLRHGNIHTGGVCPHRILRNVQDV